MNGPCNKSAPRIRFLIFVMFALPLSLVAEGPSAPVVEVSHSGPPSELIVLKGKYLLLNFDRPLSRYAISEPELVEALLVTPRQLLLRGRQFGQLSLAVWDEKGTARVYDVEVTFDRRQLEERLSTALPGKQIAFTRFTDSALFSSEGLDGAEAEKIQALAEGLGIKARMAARPQAGRGNRQVLLHVQFAEVNSQTIRELGANFLSAQRSLAGALGTQQFNSISGEQELPGAASFAGSISPTVNLFLFHSASQAAGFVRLLKERRAFQTLAEPTLVALEKRPGSLLAGGEFPIPVPSSLTGFAAIEFKKFGVELNFTAEKIEDDSLILALEPAVSDLDFARGIQFGGFTVPALVERRAKTTIELRDGQTFAIAGLTNAQAARVRNRLPLFGDIPLIGRVFQSESLRKANTELLVLITAQIVKPYPDAGLPAAQKLEREDGFIPEGAIHQLLRQHGERAARSARGLSVSSLELPAPSYEKK